MNDMDEPEIVTYLDGDWGGEDGEASGLGALLHDTLSSKYEDETLEGLFDIYAAICSVQEKSPLHMHEVTKDSMRRAIRQFWITHILPEVEQG